MNFYSEDDFGEINNYKAKRMFAIFSLGVVTIFFAIFFLAILGFQYGFWSRKDTYTSPEGTYKIQVRYDAVSRPSVYYKGEQIWEYEGAGFNEDVSFDVKWATEDSFWIIYNDEPHSGKYAEEFLVSIPGTRSDDTEELESTENITQNDTFIQDVHTPVVDKIEESDNVLAPEDKFEPFFAGVVEKNGDVTSFADGFDKSNLCGILKITRGTNEFYVYGLYENSWNQLMSYIYSDKDSNISGLLEASGYSDVDVSDVSLSNQGLIVSIDEGKKIEGVYYPKGYKLFIK